MAQAHHHDHHGHHHHGEAGEGGLRLDMAGLVAATTRAASLWLHGLDGAQQRRVLWPFRHAERGDWHYAPRPRAGLPLRAMDPVQQQAAMALLESVLSARGAGKARAIMALEDILLELEQGHGPLRDRLNYAFTLFGRPGTCPWGWRIEGHHLIVNVTVAGSESLTVTPTFWGSNPARIPIGPRTGERVMANEYHWGLELARSLGPAQRAVAVEGPTSVGNIIAERGRARVLTVPTGLPFGALEPGQQELLMRLVGEYVGHAADALGVPYLDRVRRDGLEALRLAWAGGMAEDHAFYYRIHAPRLLIEFDCTQNDANHIHTVWRDPTADWGRDVLGEHYLHDHDHD